MFLSSFFSPDTVLALSSSPTEKLTCRGEPHSCVLSRRSNPLTSWDFSSEGNESNTVREAQAFPSSRSETACADYEFNSICM